MTFYKFDEKYRYNVACLVDGYLSIGEYEEQQRMLIADMIADVEDEISTISALIKENANKGIINKKGE